MEHFFRSISEYNQVSKDLERALQKVVITQRFAKNEQVLKEGQICHYFNFVNQGLIRSYYYHDGKDKTYWFYPENQFFTSWYSFFLRKPSFEYMEALEDTELLSITYDNYQELAKKYPDFGFFARRYAEIECATIDYQTKNYLDISAKEKYKRLIAEIPNVVSRVKLGHIASLIGISQETLSRIRADKN
jgi:signal-transduction protein with cAMP-binding, CBS, and nucleotidyltransferase domain